MEKTKDYWAVVNILVTCDLPPQQALKPFMKSATAFNPIEIKIESRSYKCRLSAIDEAFALCEHWKSRYSSPDSRISVCTWDGSYFKDIWADPEKRIQAILHKRLGGEVEVVTPLGDIDLLTDDQIIEIKTFKNWKSALGQLLVYSKFYPNHQKRLYLFDRKTPSKLELIKDACTEYGVVVDFEIDKGWRHEQ